MPITSLDVTGASGAPAADLPAGVVFWRLHGRVGAIVGATPGPTWQFTVGARTAPVDTSWGTTLDVNGDGYADVVVGAHGASTSTGRAYVYLGGATGLAGVPATTLTGPDGANGNFGGSVASAGDVNGDGYADLVVGAWTVSGGTGRAHVYLGGPTGLSSTPATSLTGVTGINSYFGTSVASAGDVNCDGYADVVVGAWGVSGSIGRAYVYLGGATGLASTAATTLIGSGASGQFGKSVASAGDVNGDGYADVVVGSYGLGTASIFHGSAAGLSATPATTLAVAAAANWFGESVACAGDVNGDGYTDVVVGAGAVNVAFVFHGSVAGVSGTPGTSLVGPDGGVFGYSVGTAGDQNGDGYGDVVIGAYAALSTTGRAYVYLGSATGLSNVPFATITGPDGANNWFSYSGAYAGDVNGDGFPDLVFGAPYVLGSAGRAYLYLGSATGPSVPAARTLTGPDGANGYFGFTVASARDANPTEG